LYIKTEGFVALFHLNKQYTAYSLLSARKKNMFLLDSTPGKMSRNNKQSNLIKGKHRISKNTTSKPEEREDIERLLNEIEE
jgi:hypothetical protein